MKKLMNLLGLLLLSLTISLSTTSCGDKDDKKDDKEENNKSNKKSGNENSGNENSGNENSGNENSGNETSVDETSVDENSSNWPKGLISGCEKMMLDQMTSDPMPAEVRDMLTDFPTYEEIASCVCETMASNYPTISDLSELENIDESALGMQMIDCMGEDFKKLMEMGGM